MIKSLLDGLQHQEQARDDNDEPSMTELMVTGVHVHHNFAIIEKGLNTEQGAPGWLRTVDHSRTYVDK
jgi:demethylmacrocin O-methyltransferase